MPGLRAASLVRPASNWLRRVPLSKSFLRQTESSSLRYSGNHLDTSCQNFRHRSSADRSLCQTLVHLRGLTSHRCQQAGAGRNIRSIHTTSLMAANASNAASSQESEEIHFGPYKVRGSEVFYESNLSRALVNMKPIVPGHALIIPKKVVQRFVDLSPEQVADLWITAQKVGAKLEKYFGASSLTFAIQDGPQAGQTVPHVHIHVLPRKVGDFENNDDIYDEIDKNEKSLSDKLKVDSQRKPRTLEEMAKEAAMLRSLFT